MPEVTRWLCSTAMSGRAPEREMRCRDRHDPRSGGDRNGPVRGDPISVGGHLFVLVLARPAE